jgi:hypothetical protein
MWNLFLVTNIFFLLMQRLFQRRFWNWWMWTASLETTWQVINRFCFYSYTDSIFEFNALYYCLSVSHLFPQVCHLKLNICVCATHKNCSGIRTYIEFEINTYISSIYWYKTVFVVLCLCRSIFNNKKTCLSCDFRSTISIRGSWVRAHSAIQILLWMIHKHWKVPSIMHNLCSHPHPLLALLTQATLGW